MENTLNYEAAANLQDELAGEGDRLRLLLQVTNAVVTQLETEPLFQAISGCLRQTLDVEMASLTLWDEENNQLRRQALDLEGSHYSSPRDSVVPIKGTIPGDAFSTRRPLVMKGRDPSIAFWPFARALFDQGYCPVCSVPLISRDRVLGTFNVGSRREDITQAEVELLAQVGGQIAIALDNAGAYGRIEELNARLSRQLNPPAEVWLVCTKIKEVVDVVRHENNHACTISVIPFDSTIVLDTREYLQPVAMLRIRITQSSRP